jgi:hypothetical protein
MSQTTMKRLYALFLLLVGFYYLLTTREPAPARPAQAVATPAAGPEDPGQVH